MYELVLAVVEGQLRPDKVLVALNAAGFKATDSAVLLNAFWVLSLRYPPRQDGQQLSPARERLVELMKDCIKLGKVRRPASGQRPFANFPIPSFIISTSDHCFSQ